MKTTNFTGPKHGAVTYLTLDELKSVAAHWKVDIKLDWGSQRNGNVVVVGQLSPTEPRRTTWSAWGWLPHASNVCFPFKWMPAGGPGGGTPISFSPRPGSPRAFLARAILPLDLDFVLSYNKLESGWIWLLARAELPADVMSPEKEQYMVALSS
jgi:hypothetical protein